jgi:hypothetical protein
MQLSTHEERKAGCDLRFVGAHSPFTLAPDSTLLDSSSVSASLSKSNPSRFHRERYRQRHPCAAHTNPSSNDVYLVSWPERVTLGTLHSFPKTRSWLSSKPGLPAMSAESVYVDFMYCIEEDIAPALESYISGGLVICSHCFHAESEMVYGC